MLTKNMWKLYLNENLEFCISDLIAGNLLIIVTPLTLLFDLFFIIPEIIIYKSWNRKE